MVRWIAIFLVKHFVRFFYHHKIFGIEHIDKGGGILAANHASFLDPPILGISCPDVIHFLARESLFKFPPFRWLIRQLNTHPVTKGKENVATFKKACEMLESNKKIVVFPEGTRSKDGEIKKGQAGVGMLVVRTKCKVIPAYIHGTYSIWNSQQKYPKLKGRTACVFGSALDFTEILNSEKSKKEIQQIIVDTIMEAIQSLQKWYLEGAKGSPP
jgi:1-acyl-sn-glycerol-3-phosphate acyltransferase